MRILVKCLYFDAIYLGIEFTSILPCDEKTCLKLYEFGFITTREKTLAFKDCLLFFIGL